MNEPAVIDGFEQKVQNRETINLIIPVGDLVFKDYIQKRLKELRMSGWIMHETKDCYSLQFGVILEPPKLLKNNP